MIDIFVNGISTSELIGIGCPVGIIHRYGIAVAVFDNVAVGVIHDRASPFAAFFIGVILIHAFVPETVYGTE